MLGISINVTFMVNMLFQIKVMDTMIISVKEVKNQVTESQYSVCRFNLFDDFSLLQGLLFVSSNSGLVEVPVANCSNYLSCGECVLSRDPYCAWTGRLCRDVRMAPPDR